MSATVEITGLLRSVWPRHTAKHAARHAGMSIRTAQDWLSARATPSAATLIRMARANDALRAELIRSLEGQHEEPRQMLLPLDGAAMPARGHAQGGRGSTLASEG